MPMGEWADCYQRKKNDFTYLPLRAAAHSRMTYRWHRSLRPSIRRPHAEENVVPPSSSPKRIHPQWAVSLESVLVRVFCPRGSWEGSVDTKNHRKQFTIVSAPTRRSCSGEVLRTRQPTHMNLTTCFDQDLYMPPVPILAVVGSQMRSMCIYMQDMRWPEQHPLRSSQARSFLAPHPLQSTPCNKPDCNGRLLLPRPCFLPSHCYHHRRCGDPHRFRDGEVNPWRLRCHLNHLPHHLASPVSWDPYGELPTALIVTTFTNRVG